MAYVITVAGAGGKSGLIEALATQYAARGKRVAVTTTTHMFCRPDRLGVSYSGRIEGTKLAYPGDSCYEELCRKYDVVLVEGDGSHHRPIKIPADYEPVIPENTDEIFVVMGLCAVGRPFAVVCHRAGFADEEDRRLLNGDREPMVERDTSQVAETPVSILFEGGGLVTEPFIDHLARKYYLEPLRKRYPGVPVHDMRSDMTKRRYEECTGEGGKRRTLAALVDDEEPVQSMALILMASGYGRRFGGNKLLCPYRGKPLYRWGLDALLEAKRLLECPFPCKETDGFTDNPGAVCEPVQAKVMVVSRYDGILNEENYSGRVQMVENPDYAEGIAGSVRAGTRAAFADDSCGAVAFFVADQPHLDGKEIARFLREYLCSGKTMGCLFTDHPGNPAVFRRGMETELLSLTGDAGAGRLLREHPEKVHHYIVDEAKWKDMDLPWEND